MSKPAVAIATFCAVLAIAGAVSQSIPMLIAAAALVILILLAA